MSEKQKAEKQLALIAILLMLAGVSVTMLAVVSMAGLTGSPGISASKIFIVLLGLAVLGGGVVLMVPAGKRQIILVFEKLTAPPVWHIQSADIVLLAMWLGLITGFAESVVWFVRKFLLRTIDPTFPYSSDLVWMAPLVYLGLFAILGLFLGLLNWRWTRIVSLPIVAFIFIALGSFGVLDFVAPWLELYARLILTVAIAFQVTRLIANCPSQFYKLVRFTTGWLPFFKYSRESSPGSVSNGEALLSRRQFLLNAGTTLAGLAMGAQVWRQLIEWSTLTKLPAVTSNLPNVLLIVLDTVRAQNVSAYGYARRTTPNLEFFAKTGVSFQRAIATAPWTLPSHASIFTGRWHHELSADWTEPLDATHPTLAEVLSRHGYVTAGFVANLDFLCKPYGLARGFTHYEDFPVSAGQAILGAALGRSVTNTSKVRDLIGYHDVLNRKSADQITNDFLQWHAGQSQRPFFAFLNYYDAHQPYLPPAPYDVKFGPKRSGGKFIYFTNDAERAEMWNLSPAQIQEELDAYDGTIAYMDSSLGLLFDELARRGALENTLVIVTSDHGEQFGEHGLFGHTNSLYIPTLHVPLFVAYPSRLPANANVVAPVTLRDIPATVMDLIGLGDESPFPGSSLKRYWEAKNQSGEAWLAEINGGGFSWQKWYPVTRGDMKSLIRDNYHYIRRGDGQEELYDWISDPMELRDRSNSAEGQKVVIELRAILNSMLST